MIVDSLLDPFFALADNPNVYVKTAINNIAAAREGVLEVVEDDAGGTYRAIYTVKFEEAVFVLHCFQKKSKRGIATPKRDIDIIRARLKVAAALAEELRNEKTAH